MPTTYEPIESPDETTIFPYHEMTPPALADVFAAATIVDQHLPRTPLVRSDPLSDLLEAEVYLKRDETLPTGAFKVRGGVNLGATLAEEFKGRGMIAASTGNHGQSIAYAGNRFDIPVIIAAPKGANPDKVAAMERLGATVELHGGDFDEAREWAEEQAASHGYRYVHSGNEPKLVAGVATAGLEVVQELPTVDYAFCPVGGGSCASGYCLTVGQLADAAIIGVQSSAAPSVHEAWHGGHLDAHNRMQTFAEGLATRVPFALTMSILQEQLADFVLVDDDDLLEAMRRLLFDEHIVVEGAGAASLAGAMAYRDEIVGDTVVLQLSGRNLSRDKLVSLVE